ncbi:MAG: methionyl-tRNA formyltransferase [Clostridia bacterium]
MNNLAKNINIVFMGTPHFAKCSLQNIVESGFNVAAVFTNPDKPAGRGMKLCYSPVKEYAKSQNIEVFQPVKLRKNSEVVEILKRLKPDIIVVVAYGKILPDEILQLPRLGCINVHGSLLPKYRGAAPIQWAIINGEKTTGITTMFMDSSMDTGDMLLKEEIDIEENDNFESLYQKLEIIGAKLVVQTLDNIIEQKIIRVKQSEEFTLAPLITKDMTKIDFNKSAREVFNFVRGLSPQPATFMEFFDGKHFKVYDTKVIDENYSTKIGSICYLSKDNMYIQCSTGCISILQIQAPNGKRMKIKDFLAGNKLEIDQVFN